MNRFYRISNKLKQTAHLSHAEKRGYADIQYRPNFHVESFTSKMNEYVNTRYFRNI